MPKVDKILKVISSVFGTSDITDKLFDLFKGNKQKQRDFELLIADRISVEFEQELKDLQDARIMQIEALKQEDKFSKRFIYYLTAFLIFSTIAVSIFPFFVEFPSENENMIQRATDFLYTVTGARVISFFFGSVNTKNKF